MFKNNKKLILSLAAYTLILGTVIVAFVFGVSARNSSSMIEVYQASRNIEVGVITDSNFTTNYIVKTKIQKATYDELTSKGAEFITNTSQLKQSSLIDIAKGTPLMSSMFGDIQTGEVVDKYIKMGFEAPYYAVFNVKAENTPATGFEQDKKLFIEGTVELSSESYDQDISGDAQQTYNGIISSKCVVHSLHLNKDMELEKIGVMVEMKDYPKINYFNQKGEIKFHDAGKNFENVEIWETTHADIISNLWASSGFSSNLAKKVDTYIDYINLRGEREKQILANYSGDVFTGNVDPTFIQLKPDGTVETKVTFKTPYSNILITHYNLEGNEVEGIYTDLSGKNTPKTYDSKTGLYTYTFSKEGYYAIECWQDAVVIEEESGVKFEKTEFSKVNEMRFVIEKDANKQTFNSGLSLNIGVSSLDNKGNKKFEGSEFTGTLSKNYFEYLLKYANVNLSSDFIKSLTPGLIDFKDFNNSKFDSNNLGVYSGLKITDVSLREMTGGKVNDVKLSLMYPSNSLMYYKKASSEQIESICSLIGVAEGDYLEFLKNLSEAQAQKIIENLKNFDKLSPTYTGNFNTSSPDKKGVIPFIILNLWNKSFSFGLKDIHNLAVLNGIELALNFTLENGEEIIIDINLVETPITLDKTLNLTIIEIDVGNHINEELNKVMQVALGLEVELVAPKIEGYRFLYFQDYAGKQLPSNGYKGTITVTEEHLHGINAVYERTEDNSTRAFDGKVIAKKDYE